MAHLKEVLLCDEITASLDAQTAIEIENRILDLKEETVLYVTHKYFDETLKKFDCILVFLYLNKDGLLNRDHLKNL